MLIVEEVWLDPSDDGKASRVRMSVKPANAASAGLGEGRSLSISLAGPDGPIGCAQIRYVAVIKGLAIVEVDQFFPADAQCQQSLPSLPAFSAHRQAGL